MFLTRFNKNDLLAFNDNAYHRGQGPARKLKVDLHGSGCCLMEVEKRNYMCFFHVFNHY